MKATIPRRPAIRIDAGPGSSLRAVLHGLEPIILERFEDARAAQRYAKRLAPLLRDSAEAAVRPRGSRLEIWLTGRAGQARLRSCSGVREAVRFAQAVNTALAMPRAVSDEEE